MKVRKWVKATFIIFIIFVVMFININKIGDEEKRVDYSSLVYEKLKDYNVSREFITWIDNNYKGSLEKLDDLLKTKEYDLSFWHKVTGYSYIVLNDLYNNKYDNMDNVKILELKEASTISIVGDVSLADNWYIMPKYDERGKKVLGILSNDVVETMNNSDVMIANSEFTISKRGTALSGKQYTFRAKPERLSIYYEMGIDMVTLANNHVYDFGQTAFLDMLDSFVEYNIPHIGAGRNIEEAKKPYYFIINGYKFAFVNATRAEKYIMTPEAKENTPGVFRCYDPTNLINLIKEVKLESDYVITIIHFGKEGSHELEKEQIDVAKKSIDAGASVVVGHHAHTLQGVEIYKDKPIIYNLGDFIFNSESEETAMFQIKLDQDGNMDYYLIPALQQNCYTKFLKDNDKQKLINKINSWSINAKILEDGKIISS